jgi:FKBP-type peptidyl-prolyl cis-trans isomerase FkpA
MKQSIYLFAAAFLLLAGCKQPFKKLGKGLEYKIISDNKGEVIKQGNFFEISFEQRYKGTNKDTSLFNSRESANQIVTLDSLNIPADYYKIFSQSRKGDSIVVRQLTDTIMKMQPGGIPDFIKKGGHIISLYKIVNVYAKRESADSAFQAQMTIARAKDSLKALAQIAKDEKEIKDYLAKKGITATKAPMGTYVQIINPGTGDVLDTSKVAKVLYTGRNLSGGKPFDSNTDPQFNHMQAYPVVLKPGPGGQYGVIKGWIDGLLQLKKGAKAIFYIPSSLAYGAQGSGEIKPNAILMFDIEVADVIGAAQFKTEQDAERKLMEAEQKKYMDSVKKAQKDTLRK